jgi:hypothetical protein
MSRLALVIPLLLVAAAPARKPPPGHPDGRNPAPDACETCHAEATPEVLKAWEGSAHGLVLVKCFVCHGSTGKDFARAPGAGRCEGCHPAESASIVPAKGTKGAKAPAPGCFGCHDAHALTAEGKPNPHAR